VHRRHERSLQLHAKLCEYMYKHGPGVCILYYIYIIYIYQ
jgi:hypothetical protein